MGVMAEAAVKVVEAWKESATVEEKKLWQGGWWEPRTGDWWGAGGRGWIRSPLARAVACAGRIDVGLHLHLQLQAARADHDGPQRADVEQPRPPSRAHTRDRRKVHLPRGGRVRDRAAEGSQSMRTTPPTGRMKPLSMRAGSELNRSTNWN